MKSLNDMINESGRFGLGETLEMTYVYDYVNQHSALAYDVSALLEKPVKRKVSLGLIGHIKRCLHIPDFD